MKFDSPWIVFISLAMLLIACVSLRQPLPPVPQGAPPEFPSGFYQQALNQGNRVQSIIADRSLITVYAFRGGALAAAGHDHVVASHDIHGYILLKNNPSETRADLYFPVATLTVDEQALRREAKFTSQPSDQDVEATRQNMLRSVLDSANFPYVSMSISGPEGTPPAVTLNAQLTLHGQTRNITIPATLRVNGNSTETSGEFHVKQTDFGITPYSILGGALAVKNELRIDFRIVAQDVRSERSNVR